MIQIWFSDEVLDDDQQVSAINENPRYRLTGKAVSDFREDDVRYAKTTITTRKGLS